MSGRLPIFVITLPDAAHRRAPLIGRLDDAGVAYELWDGVDGRRGLPPGEERHIDRETAKRVSHRALGDAEFACALSHHHLYAEIVRRGLEAAIVLEDDAQVAEPFFGFHQGLETGGWDLLILDHRKTFVRRSDSFPLPGAAVAHPISVAGYLTTGYAISGDGARAMLDRSLPLTAPADWPFDISELRSYAVLPRLVGHSDTASGHSDIRHQRKDIVPLHRIERFARRSYWRRKARRLLARRIS